jgi:hypothetical protein
MRSLPTTPFTLMGRKSSWVKKDRDQDKAAKKAAKQERKRKKGEGRSRPAGQVGVGYKGSITLVGMEPEYV